MINAFLVLLGINTVFMIASIIRYNNIKKNIKFLCVGKMVMGRVSATNQPLGYSGWGKIDTGKEVFDFRVLESTVGKEMFDIFYDWCKLPNGQSPQISLIGKPFRKDTGELALMVESLELTKVDNITDKG